MKAFKSLICGLLLAGVSAPAFATDFHNWSVGVAGGQAFPTGPDAFWHSAKQDFHGSAWVRYHVSNPLAFEFNYNRMGFVGKNDGNSDPHLDAYTVNAVLTGRLGRRWAQVGAVGVGLGDVADYGGQSYKDLMGIVRYGFTYDLRPAWTIGAHAQFNYLAASNPRAPAEMHSLSYLISLAYSFGGETTATPEAHADPAPVPVAAAPLDSDGDGVPDSMDKCPNTPAGAKVNSYGCQIHEKAAVKLDLEFETGKATVTSLMEPMLKDLAKFMQDNPRTHIQVEGYTDNTGSAATNKRLSQKRASAIRQSLIKDHGVDASRLTAKGYGSANPVADNSTADGREKNRRVITVIEEK